MACGVGRDDQYQQPLILPCPPRERILHPGIEPTTRHVEEAAHHSRIKLSPMGFDEGVLDSDMLRSVQCHVWILIQTLKTSGSVA
jgi:hypothetical protein